jgi:hypothetical protein
LLRVWLFAGSAYTVPRGTTVLRGRVMRVAGPARWARVTATVANTVVVAGRAHTDERGEFLLVITDVNQNPLDSTVTVDLSVVAPKLEPSQDVLADPDRCADLVAEDVPRSAVPATAADLDNDVLRGVAPPNGYVANLQAPTQVVATVGAEVKVPGDLVFHPQP